MKKLIGLTALVGGLLLAVVPRYILPACEYEGFSRMHCSDTAQAELLSGAILMAVGFTTFFLRSAKTTIAAAGSGLLLFIVSYKLPDIFGYCRSSRMPCNYGMVPGIRFIAVAGSIIMVLSLAGAIRGNRKKGTSA